MDDIIRCGNEIRTLLDWLHHQKPKGLEVGDMRHLVELLTAVNTVLVSAAVNDAGLAQQVRHLGAKQVLGAASALSNSIQR